MASRKFMYVKFMFFKKATKIDEIFTVDLTLCSKCQIDGEDFVNFCGLLRKHKLYQTILTVNLPVQQGIEIRGHSMLRLDATKK